MITIATALLQTALALLLAAQSPNVSDALKQNAIQAANQAISYATQALQQQPQPQPQAAERLRVSFTNTESRYSGINIMDTLQRYGDGTTRFFLDTTNPVVEFYLNGPADPNTVSWTTVLARSNGQYLLGRKVSYVVEQGQYQSATFPMYKIVVDLRTVDNLAQFVGRNIEIILTPEVRSPGGVSLEQCTVSNNLGECAVGSNGKRLEAYGFVVKLLP